MMDEGKINFITTEGQIEELAGRRKFWLIPKAKIKEYEKRMLCDSSCPYTLSMCFLTENGVEKAYYDFTGFAQLGDYLKQKVCRENTDRENGTAVRETLKILSGILDSLKGMERYLLFPDRYAVHFDAVFLELNSGRAVFAFYPCGEQKTPLQKNMLLLLDHIVDCCDDEVTCRYLNQLKEAINSQNAGLDGIIAILGTIRREIGYIYWNPDSFRSAERNDIPEFSDADHQKNLPRKITIFQKSSVVHAALAVSLSAVLLSGRLDPINFAGLVIVTAGVDFWILHRIKK